MFKPASGKWEMRKMPRKTNTAYTVGMMIYNDNTDNVFTTTTTQCNIKGIVQETYASEASTEDIYVLCPCEVSCTFFATGGSGTLTKAMEGDQFDFASGGLTIAQATSTYDPVELVKFISATEGEFKFNYTFGVED